MELSLRQGPGASDGEDYIRERIPGPPEAVVRRPVLPVGQHNQPWYPCSRGTASGRCRVFCLIDLS